MMESDVMSREMDKWPEEPKETSISTENSDLKSITECSKQISCIGEINKQNAINGLMTSIAYLEVTYASTISDVEHHINALFAILKFIEKDEDAKKYGNHVRNSEQKNAANDSPDESMSNAVEENEELYSSVMNSLSRLDNAISEDNVVTYDETHDENSHKETEYDGNSSAALAKKRPKTIVDKISPKKISFRKKKNVSKKHSIEKLPKLPDCLTLKASSIRDIGDGLLGTFTKTFVPGGACFGPCPTEIVERYNDCGTAEIRISKHEYDDEVCLEEVPEKTLLHWMRYVHYTNVDQDQSVQLIKSGEHIFLETNQDMLPNMELLLPGTNLNSEIDKLRKPTKKLHECVSCGEKFQRKIDLIKHLQIHSDVKPHKCEDCGKYLKSLSSIHYHKKLHAGEKEFKCRICEKSFTYRSGLNSHMRTHEEDKPFACEQCGKTFTQLGNLQTHERVHTGERPFTCDICQLKFSHRSTLRAHRFRHTGEKKYQCPICGKRYNRDDVLKIHLNLHKNEKNHKCNICGKDFIQRGYLNSHMEVHTEGKSHLCTTCGERFSRSQSLKRHINVVHLKVYHGKKHECVNCNKEFKRSDHLARHMKSAHRNSQDVDTTHSASHSMVTEPLIPIMVTDDYICQEYSETAS